jgi:hypothetical protein
MSATTLMLTIEPGVLEARSSWAEFESLVVAMSREVPLRAWEEWAASFFPDSCLIVILCCGLLV